MRVRDWPLKKHELIATGGTDDREQIVPLQEQLNKLAKRVKKLEVLCKKRNKR